MLDFITSFFSLNLTTALGIFSLIALVSTIVAFIVTIFSFIFDGGDLDVDGIDSDLGTLSVRSVLGFFLGFGWGGFIAIRNGSSVLVAVLIGILLGFVMFGIIAALMRFIYSFRSDGTLKYETLVGMSGAVYVTIPPNRESGGQVKIAHPSQLFYLPAVQLGDTPLPANSPVVVTEVNSGILTVAPK